MFGIERFKILIDLFTGAAQRSADEHEKFLEFFQQLITITPNNLAKAFGNIGQIHVINPDSYALESAGLELTAIDYMWWSAKITKGYRIKSDLLDLRSDIFDRLSKLVEVYDLTQEEKTLLMSLSNDYLSV